MSETAGVGEAPDVSETVGLGVDVGVGESAGAAVALGRAVGVAEADARGAREEGPVVGMLADAVETATSDGLADG